MNPRSASSKSAVSSKGSDVLTVVDMLGVSLGRERPYREARTPPARGASLVVGERSDEVGGVGSGLVVGRGLALAELRVDGRRARVVAGPHLSWVMSARVRVARLDRNIRSAADRRALCGHICGHPGS